MIKKIDREANIRIVWIRLYIVQNLPKERLKIGRSKDGYFVTNSMKYEDRLIMQKNGISLYLPE